MQHRIVERRVDFGRVDATSEQALDRSADRRGRRVAGQALEGRVHRLHDPGRIVDDDEVRRLLDRGGQAEPVSFATAQLGHVVHEQQELLGRVVRAEMRQAPDLYTAERPVGQAPVSLAQPRSPGLRHLHQAGDRRRIQGDGDNIGHTPPHDVRHRQANVPGEGRIRIGDPQTGVIDDDDGVGRLLDDGGQPPAIADRFDPILGGLCPIGRRSDAGVGCGEVQPLELLRDRHVGVGERSLGRFGTQVPESRRRVAGGRGRIPASGDSKPGSGGFRPGPTGGQPAHSGCFAGRSRRIGLRVVLGGLTGCVAVGACLIEVGCALIADRIRLVALRRSLVGV